MTPRTLIRRPRSLATALVVAALAVPCAGAAEAPPAPPPPPDVFFIGHGGPVMALGAPVDIVAGQGSIVGEVVAGKPYTADAVTEFTQRLADGNRISHTNKARVHRDSAGRTRREHDLNALGAWQNSADQPATMVVIDDPVADTSYILDPGTKTARQMRPFHAVHDSAAGVVTWEAAVPAPPPPGAASGAVTVAIGTAVESTAPAPHPESGTFEVPLPPAVHHRTIVRAFPPSAVAPAMQPFPASDTRTEDLGEQELQGVLAKGTRYTQVIPAGAIGNEREIEIVSEQWYSPDLETIVLRRNLDPRFGETTYQLVNLVRGEPSADLFAVPGNYEILKAPDID